MGFKKIESNDSLGSATKKSQINLALQSGPPSQLPEHLSETCTTRANVYQDVSSGLKISESSAARESTRRPSNTPKAKEIPPPSPSNSSAANSWNCECGVSNSELTRNFCATCGRQRSWNNSERDAGLVSRWPSETPKIENTPTTRYKTSHNHLSIRSYEEYMWFCSECGDGPYGTWQVSCHRCRHPKCTSCRIEQTCLA
jgi:hypothetical protein